LAQANVGVGHEQAEHKQLKKPETWSIWQWSHQVNWNHRNRKTIIDDQRNAYYFLDCEWCCYFAIVPRFSSRQFLLLKD
jgi:hypothetical protein